MPKRRILFVVGQEGRCGGGGRRGRPSIIERVIDVGPLHVVDNHLARGRQQVETTRATEDCESGRKHSGPMAGAELGSTQRTKQQNERRTNILVVAYHGVKILE